MSDTYMIEVGAKGRVVIPAAARRQLGVEEGTELVGVLERDGLLLMRPDAARRRLRELFAGTPDLVEELLADRQAEVLRDRRPHDQPITTR